MEHVARHHHVEALVRPGQRIRVADTEVHSLRKFSFRYREHLRHGIDTCQARARMVPGDPEQQFAGPATYVKKLSGIWHGQALKRFTRRGLDIKGPLLVVVLCRIRVFLDYRINIFHRVVYRGQDGLMVSLISFGVAKTIDARSPCMPAPTTTGLPGAGPSLLESDLKLRLNYQIFSTLPSAVSTL